MPQHLPLASTYALAAHEAARAEAAKVKKNPQSALLASIRADLEQINKDLSFGVSFSQGKRNDHAKELVTKVYSASNENSSPRPLALE